SALHGAGAFNGVLHITTKSARESAGGEARISAGNLNGFGADFRQSGGLSNDWTYKVDAGFRRSDDFSRSRTGRVEYRPDLLMPEVIPLQFDRVRIGYANLRLDKEFGNAGALTAEAGNTNSSGPVFTTGAGRVQLSSANNPWGRVNFSTPIWNAQA